MKILHLDSSILGENSVSRQLSNLVVDKILESNPNAQVTYHDLVKNPISHLSGEVFTALALQPSERSELQEQEAETSSRALEEFLEADLIIIGAPMYNFSVPSQLKAWIDRISVAGKTFRYTANGPEGLAGGKKVIIVSSRGSVFTNTAYANSDHQETYLRTVFGFLGITDINFIRAEGVAVSPEHKQTAIAGAKQQILLAQAQA